MATYPDIRLQELLDEQEKKKREWLDAIVRGTQIKDDPETLVGENSGYSLPYFSDFQRASRLKQDLERRIAQGEFANPWATPSQTEVITETDTVSDVDDVDINTETYTDQVVDTARKLPLIEITEGRETTDASYLTSFSDRLKNMNLTSMDEMFPYPVMDPAVVAQRKALQRKRDQMRALYQRGPKDIVWSDNLTTKQMEDIWKRQRSAYMAKIMQQANPQTRADINAIAKAAGLDQDEWKEMLTLFDASRPNITRKKTDLEISNLIEKGLVKQAAREWVTSLDLHVLQDDDNFARELHQWQARFPLASGKDFTEEVKAQRDLIYKKPKDAKMLTLTDPDGNPNLGYAKFDKDGIPQYYLSETGEKVEITPGWTISSPMATQVDIKTGIEPTKAMKLNLAESSLRNTMYAMERMVKPDGTLNFTFLDAFAAQHSIPGTSGRTTQTIMANAVGDALRIESGAVISPDELLQMVERYVPQVGDTEEAKKYKIREFYERVAGQIRKTMPEWAEKHLPHPVWAPGTILGEDNEDGSMSEEQKKHFDALVPGSYFQTRQMKVDGLLGRKPSKGQIGW